MFTLLTKPHRKSVQKLRAFQREVSKVAATSVGPWHVEQVAGYIAMVLEENGDRKASAQELHRLARESHREMIYNARSVRDKATFAAELYESLGEDKTAKQLRKEVTDIDWFIKSRIQRMKRAK
jgi:hypothetical protein